MVERRLCSFCGGDIEPGTGTMYVKRDGTLNYFCRSKCSRNQLDLKRNPRKVRWTLHHMRSRGLEARREAVGVGVLKKESPPAEKKATKPAAKPAAAPPAKKPQPAKKE